MDVRISPCLNSFDFRKNLNNSQKRAEKRSVEGSRREYGLVAGKGEKW